MSAALTIREQTSATDEVVELLRNAVSGSEGGIRIRDEAPDVDRVRDATWLTAWRGDRIAGTYALVPRPWGWWRCNFAVHPNEDAVAVGALLVDEAKARLIERCQPGQVIAGSHDDTNHFLRGLLIDAGYDDIAAFDLFVWSRRRRDTSVGPVEERELEEVHERLNNRAVHWSDANLTLKADQFLVLRDSSGRIRAGAQLCPMTWTVESLGRGSAVSMPLLRVFGVSLTPLKWASIHHCFGEVDDLARVWEAALFRWQIPAALIGIDVLDPRYQSWRARPRGAVGRIAGVSTTIVTGTSNAPGPLDWSPIFAT